MKGTAHAVIGAVAGFGAAKATGADVDELLFLIGAGTISGLVPDLDTGGTLTNRMTVSNKFLNTAVRFMGILLGLYAYFYTSGKEAYPVYISAFILLFVLPRLSRKIMLLITGIIFAGAGYYTAATWLMLFGGYIMIAAFLAHRTYTHSLLGLAYYGLIAHYLELDFQITGLSFACVLGYSSHLIADMRVIPGNKRGIKLFLPYKRLEL